MGLWRRSLAEDNIDRYNHTLSVIFLLFLSLVTWLLPLSPSLQSQNYQNNSIFIPSQDSTTVVENATTPKLRTKAACWCPSDYTGAMVNYVHSACSSAFLRALQGKDYEGGVALYLNYIVYHPNTRDKFKPNVTFPQIPTVGRKIIHHPQEAVNDDVQDGAWTFIRVETPWVLFLLAVGLALPHLVCLLLSSLLSGFNVHQTLTVGVTGAGLDQESRRQLYKDIAHALTRATASCSWAVGVIYLLLKTLAVIAAVVGLLMVHGDLLPRARSLKADVENNPPMAFEVTTSEDMEANNKNGMVEGNVESFDGQILVCEVPIRQLSDTHRWTLQCIFNVEMETFARSVMSDPSKSLQAVPPTHAPLPVSEVYVTLFLIVQTHLLVLTIVNVFSLITWVAKLFIGPCKSKVMSGRGRLPLDVVFLLQMAMENTGPDVAHGLSQGWPSGDKSEKEEEGLALSE